MHALRTVDAENQTNVSVMTVGVVRIVTKHYVWSTRKIRCAVGMVAVVDPVAACARLGTQGPTANGLRAQS